jgi:hypothetical protein
MGGWNLLLNDGKPTFHASRRMTTITLLPIGKAKAMTYNILFNS